jgi:hypothetical protein
MRPIISATLIQEEENVSKFNMEKMLKVNQFCNLQEVRRHNKDGELSTLMKLRRSQLKVLTKTGDSISTDLSILDLDSQ